MLALSLLLEKQEDQEKRRKVKTNLQVRKISATYTIHISWTGGINLLYSAILIVESFSRHFVEMDTSYQQALIS